MWRTTVRLRSSHGGRGVISTWQQRHALAMVATIAAGWQPQAAVATVTAGEHDGDGGRS